jgi:hypothetical protein
MRLMTNIGQGLRPASASTIVPAWETGVIALKNEFRRDTAETPIFIFQALSTIRAASNTVRPGLAPELWRRVAPSAATWDITGAVISEYPAWSGGSAVSAGEVVYDAWAIADYEAVSGIANSPNWDIRPSVAVSSPDPSIARLWKRKGIANAHRMFDGETLTRTAGAASSNVILQTTSATACGTVMLFGMRGVASVTVKGLNPSTGSTLETKTAALAYTGDTGTRATAAVTMDAAFTRFEITLTRDSAVSRVECGMVALGVPIAFGETAQNVVLKGENFSRTEENQWGNIDFLRRGHLTEADVRVFVTQARADYLVQALNRAQGMPVAFDLNCADTDFEHMRVWGFYRDFAIPYRGFGDTEIAFAVRSLVETL